MFSVAERYWIANVTFGYIVVRGSQRAKVPKQQPKNNNKSIQWKINVSLASNIAVSLLWITFAIHVKFYVVDNVNVILLFFSQGKIFQKSESPTQLACCLKWIHPQESDLPNSKGISHPNESQTWQCVCSNLCKFCHCDLGSQFLLAVSGHNFIKRQNNTQFNFNVVVVTTQSNFQ